MLRHWHWYMKRMLLLVILEQYLLLMDQALRLLKIHNGLVDGLPNYRPIISQIGSPTYKIAKYLLDFISPITKNEYTLKDSFEFVSMIDKQDHNSFMCSFDIDSLFTNVPLEETIEIVIKNVFGRKRKINGLSKSDFRDLLK